MFFMARQTVSHQFLMNSGQLQAFNVLFVVL